MTTTQVPVVMPGTSEQDRRHLLAVTPGGGDVDNLPRLFEEYSRLTADLVSAHDNLLEQVATMQSELAAKNRRLERKKRLEALGRVAAGVAHEFRNPLGGMRLTVDALLADIPDAQQHERLDRIRRAIQHLDHIVGELLSFTRCERLAKCPVRVNELIDEALHMAFSEPSAVDARLVREGDAETELLVDRHAFTQVLVNLLTNAEEAMAPAPGRLAVGWGRRGRKHWLEIADEGPGIPTGEEERVFHPFHSLRDGGTGLGLAIVHSRVEAHDGEIAVVRKPWGKATRLKGALFRVTLPVHDLEKELRS
ncbi:MAG: sensor histidine kinase [Planctomycetota bacterium]